MGMLLSPDPYGRTAAQGKQLPSATIGSLFVPCAAYNIRFFCGSAVKVSLGVEDIKSPRDGSISRALYPSL